MQNNRSSQKTDDHSTGMGAFQQEPIQSVENRLSQILDDAIDLAYLGEKRIEGLAIARHVFSSEPALMEELKEAWMVEKLAWYINRKRGERWRSKLPQINLPGFEDMPRTIFLRSGERPRLEYATVGVIEDHVKMLRARLRDSPKVRKMEAVLALMRHYSCDRDHRDITWQDVKKRELERLDFERIVGS